MNNLQGPAQQTQTFQPLPSPMPSPDHGPRSGHELFSWVIVVIVSIVGAYFLNGYLSKIPEKGIEAPPIVNKTADPALSEFEGWQTYRNKEFGFEVKYPGEWAVSEATINSKVQLLSMSIYSRQLPGAGTFNISVYNNTQNLDLETWSSKYIKYDAGEVINKKALITAGQESTSTYIQFDNRLAVEYLVDKSGLIYSLAFDEEDSLDIQGSINKEIYHQILSTFKFIDQTDTSTWQTYRNDEFGFEVKYPENLKFSRIYKYQGVTDTFSFQSGDPPDFPFIQLEIKIINLSPTELQAVKEAIKLRASGVNLVNGLKAYIETNEQYKASIFTDDEYSYYQFAVHEVDGYSSISGVKQDMPFLEILSTFNFIAAPNAPQ